MAEMGVWEHPAQHQQQPPATWNVNDAMVLPMMGTRRSRRSIVRCNEVVTTEENPSRCPRCPRSTGRGKTARFTAAGDEIILYYLTSCKHRGCLWAVSRNDKSTIVQCSITDCFFNLCMIADTFLVSIDNWPNNKWFKVKVVYYYPRYFLCRLCNGGAECVICKATHHLVTAALVCSNLL